MDAAAMPWSAQAPTAPNHPRGRVDKPTVAFYFEKPRRAPPGAAIAFPGEMMPHDDEPECLRLRKDVDAK